MHCTLLEDDLNTYSDADINFYCLLFMRSCCLHLACPSVPCRLLFRNQRKTKIDVNVLHCKSNRCTNFQGTVKLTGRQNLKKMTHISLNYSSCSDLIDCQCWRRSRTERMAAYHVGTRRQHLFLFMECPCCGRHHTCEFHTPWGVIF